VYKRQTYNSNLSVNTTLTGFTGGTIEAVFPLQKLDSLQHEFDTANFTFEAGAEYTISALSAGASDVTVYVRAAEPTS
jgi:hypothetical protein